MFVGPSPCLRPRLEMSLTRSVTGAILNSNPPPSNSQQDIRYKLKAQLQITSDNQKQFNIIILVDLPPLPSPPPPSKLHLTVDWKILKILNIIVLCIVLMPISVSGNFLLANMSICWFYHWLNLPPNNIQYWNIKIFIIFPTVDAVRIQISDIWRLMLTKTTPIQTQPIVNSK